MSRIFQVQKMNCNGCARHVAAAVRSVQADAEVDVDLAAGRVMVTPTPVDPAGIAKAITDAGYPAQHVA